LKKSKTKSFVALNTTIDNSNVDNNLKKPKRLRSRSKSKGKRDKSTSILKTTENLKDIALKESDPLDRIKRLKKKRKPRKAEHNDSDYISFGQFRILLV